ncbi:NAD+ synthase [Nitrosovibrio sp. Nv17]|uniref:NAD+ synthase n=1 Tax=Nitrosovibrio sp. Nv17 TaxID=1855339 RepID=UPI0009087470|nr:NAD+ synthase [Nitrosovibrio sp. Nv17]SFW29645.1 NAD+ synthase (glutamine-hydrolysing) [Nitrosovibrio sp. Nv17]
MKLAIAQINCTVGDLDGNLRRILDFTRQAEGAGARLVVTPELALSGYPPEDLLLRDGFRLACRDALIRLARGVHGTALLVGHPHLLDGRLYNAASVIREGRILATYFKNHLSGHASLDERRYFEPGADPCVFELDGVRFGIAICQDIWQRDVAARVRAEGAQALVVLNASPYHTGKLMLRQQAARQRIEETGLPIVYANLVGGQDELVFDGASFAMDSHGDVTHLFGAFTETLGLVELHHGAPVTGAIAAPQSPEADVYQALCLGLGDYVRKNGIPGVLLGLSGGVDSALVLAVAVDALGPERVEAVMMPSPFTADISFQDARAMARTFGVRYRELPIQPLLAAFTETLSAAWAGSPATAADIVLENLQARIRGTLLMALSNRRGAIVLTTGNKSETAVGYCTLYGDMAGGFAVLKDVPKTLVYRLCRHRNALSEVIPERVLARAPSAELRPEQTDQDSLPPYDVLDGIVEAYVERSLSVPQIVSMEHFEETDVRRVVRLIRLSEHKRRQSPPGPRVTSQGFGRDWRHPITSGYREF